MRNVAIVACLAVTAMFISCSKDENALTIIFTDIPAEYNGKKASANLHYPDWYNVERYPSYRGDGMNTISNGKVSISFCFYHPGYGSYCLDSKHKGEYIITFRINEVQYDPDPVEVWYWGGESSVVNITKTISTLSFNSLKRWEDW